MEPWMPKGEKSQADWSNFLPEVPLYDTWTESLGVPIHEIFFVQDLRTIEVGPWEEMECNVAFVKLRDFPPTTEMRVTEIPPAATLPKMKFAVDNIIYVLSGRGLATVSGHGQSASFEWQPHSLFLVPRNYAYQLTNAQGHQPARLFEFNYLPLGMMIVPNVKWFWNNPALEPDVDIFGGEGFNTFSEAKYIQGAASRNGSIEGSAAWVASFFPDLNAFDKLSRDESKPWTMANMRYCLPNITSLRMGGHALAVGTYKAAHYHGPGAVVLIPGGEGMSVQWPATNKTGAVWGGGFRKQRARAEEEKPTAEQPMFMYWQEGSMFTPPDHWFHQHMNLGPTPSRYLTFHPARQVQPLYHGGDLPFVEENPIIRQTFEAELAKRGLKSQMPPELYTDPNFEGIAAFRQRGGD